MTVLPYTERDLVDEAARQHKTLTEDPDFMGIGEQMSTHLPWEFLDEESFDTAQRRVDDLLNKAANTSAWAVQLGADGLEPDATVDVYSGSRLLARLHLAFPADVPPRIRWALTDNISRAVRGLPVPDPA